MATLQACSCLRKIGEYQGLWNRFPSQCAETNVPESNTLSQSQSYSSSRWIKRRLSSQMF